MGSSAQDEREALQILLLAAEAAGNISSAAVGRLSGHTLAGLCLESDTVVSKLSRSRGKTPPEEGLRAMARLIIALREVKASDIAMAAPTPRAPKSIDTRIVFEVPTVEAVTLPLPFLSYKTGLAEHRVSSLRSNAHHWWSPTRDAIQFWYRLMALLFPWVPWTVVSGFVLYLIALSYYNVTHPEDRLTIIARLATRLPHYALHVAGRTSDFLLKETANTFASTTGLKTTAPLGDTGTGNEKLFGASIISVSVWFLRSHTAPQAPP